MKPPYRFSVCASLVFVFLSLFWGVEPTQSTSLNIRFVPTESLPVTSSMASPVEILNSEMIDPAGGIRSLPELDYTSPFSISNALIEFVSRVVNGQSQELRGVYIADVLALPVVQQPEGNYMFVSDELDIITQFQSAAGHGVVGLLAHNYLSGDLFFEIALNQEVNLIYGDGRVLRYLVSNIQSFEKLQPGSLNSSYRNISTGEEYTTAELFRSMYTGNERVTFQTCIKKGRDWSWGRIFITAMPIP